MPCKLCRFAYACRTMRKDDMNIEKARELLHKIRSETNLAPCIATLDSIKMLAKQALSELEAASESRTDRLLDELADNMAKADEAMKPDKPLEQSEFTKIIRPRIDDDNFSQADMEDACDIIDRQAAEIKRLKDFIKIEIDHAKAFKVLESEPEKSNTQMFINRAEEALERK